MQMTQGWMMWRRVMGRLGTGAAGLVWVSLLSGCGVVSLAGSAAGAAISVTGAVVSTGVEVTGKVVGGAVDAMRPAKSE